MKKFQTQILMVSGQMMPNVMPILDEAIKPEKVVLCASNEMHKSAELLNDFLKSKQVETEIYPLGYAYDFAELQERFLELATKFEDSSVVGVNLTGGTKLMTISAQMVFSDFECFYVVPEKDQILMLDEKNPDLYVIEDRISLRDYFAVHGFKANIEDKNRRRKVSEKTAILSQKILSNFEQFENPLSLLNSLAAKAESVKSLKVPVDKAFRGLEDFMRLFFDQGSIHNYDYPVLTFESNHSRDFCKGGWLEDYICGELAKVNDAVGLQDWAGSFEIVSDSGMKNEIDAAFLYHNELYVIECKTAKMGEKGKDADILYKLDTIRSYGGLYTKSIVASYNILGKSGRQRAKDLKITLVEGPDLVNFADRIIKLLSKGR